jgi:hypothetical protein
MPRSREWDELCGAPEKAGGATLTWNLSTFSGSKYSRSMGAMPKLPVSVTTSISSIIQRVLTGTAPRATERPLRTRRWTGTRRGVAARAARGRAGGRAGGTERVLSLNLHRQTEVPTSAGIVDTHAHTTQTHMLV